MQLILKVSLSLFFVYVAREGNQSILKMAKLPFKVWTFYLLTLMHLELSNTNTPTFNYRIQTAASLSTIYMYNRYWWNRFHSNIHSIDAQSNLNQAFSTSGIMIQFIDKNSIGGVFQLRVMGWLNVFQMQTVLFHLLSCCLFCNQFF